MKLVIVFLALLSVSTVLSELRDEDKEIRMNYINELYRKGLLNDDVFTELQNENLGLDIGVESVRDDIVKERDHEDRNPGIIQRVIGFFTFINVLWVFSVIMIVVSLVPLFGIYVLPRFSKLPKELVEIILWIMCFSYIIVGVRTKGTLGLFYALPGCIGIIPGFLFTLFVHYPQRERNPKKAVQVLSFFLTFVWGLTAISLESSILGFMTVVALETYFGFMFASKPFCYVIGFTDDESIPRAMGASFIMISFYVFRRSYLPWLIYFEDGALFCGSFVHFLGWLIVTNKWYDRDGDIQTYIFRNVISVFCGLVCMYLGSVYPVLGYLQKISGTFFLLWIVEKFSELPIHKEGYAWSGLILGALIYGLSMFVHQHPQYFIYSL
jgi:hypothetical protein